MKINITRSQVAQLYVELTNNNLMETFIVEGDEVVEAPIVEPVGETTGDAQINPEESVTPTEVVVPVEEAPTDVAVVEADQLPTDAPLDTGDHVVA